MPLANEECYWWVSLSLTYSLPGSLMLPVAKNGMRSILETGCCDLVSVSSLSYIHTVAYRDIFGHGKTVCLNK